jgi:hypothetical protein
MIATLSIAAEDDGQQVEKDHAMLKVYYVVRAGRDA